MSVRVTIVNGPLLPAAPIAGDAPGEFGALLVFEGIVRRAEGEGFVQALDYEVYEPMASRMLARLGADIAEKHRLLRLEVEHSRGRVPVGRASLRVTMEAAHRGAALAAMGEFIDLLKRDVPIWKSPVWET